MTDEAIKPSLNDRLKELVMDARRGDQAAYRTLLTELTPLIRRAVANRIGRWGNQHHAEDVTQDTLIAIHLKLHTYDEQLPFLAWVNAIAKHKLIDHLRKTKAVNVSLEDEGLPELVDPANPEQAGINRDLHNLLGKLKPPVGDIIYALKVEGSSVRELAAQHRLSEGNIKVIVHRGLQKLAQMMRESPI
jgi:RNA polymerase sigma-70 factor (ECF subfamily)